MDLHEEHLLGDNPNGLSREAVLALPTDGSMVVYSDFMDRRRVAPHREVLTADVVTTVAPEG
eukprot:1281645-Amphidinium_carterae.2